MDVKIKSDEIIFKYRVNGLVLNNNKILVVEIMNNGFNCLPGGHVKLGELSTDAIEREMLEELDIKNPKNAIIDKKLFAINETVFSRKDGKKVHEISLFYKINFKEDCLNLCDYCKMELDDGIEKKLDFKWVNIEDLNNVNFKPMIIVDKIKKNNWNLEHFIDL